MPHLPRIDSLEQRQLLASPAMEIWMNGGHDGDTPAPYIIWIQPAGLGDVCYKVGGCMQDYSWMGDSFTIIESRGNPMVQVSAEQWPFVIDPLAQKLWRVEDFLAEYPHGLDQIDPARVPLIDWYNVMTNSDTGKKYVMGVDMYRGESFPENSGRSSEYGQDGSGPCDQPLGEPPVVCSVDETPEEKPVEAPKILKAEKKKSKHHKRHRAKHSAASAKSFFVNPRLGRRNG